MGGEITNETLNMEATMLAQLINQILSQLPLMGPLLLLVWFLKIGNDKMIGTLELEQTNHQHR